MAIMGPDIKRIVGLSDKCQHLMNLAVSDLIAGNYIAGLENYTKAQVVLDDTIRELKAAGVQR